MTGISHVERLRLAVRHLEAAAMHLERVVAAMEEGYLNGKRGPPRLKLRPEELAQAIALYTEQKRSLRYLELSLGYSYDVIRRALIEAGVPLRSRGGNPPQSPKGELNWTSTLRSPS